MPFAYTMTKADVYNYWRDFEASQIAKRAARAAIRKEAPMVQKSMSDLAWEAFSAAARTLVAAKTYRTYEEAVDALKAASHPAYLTYLASLSSGSTPPGTTAPGDVVKVLKQAEEQRFAKKRAVQQEIAKFAAPLLRSGLSETEAWTEVFTQDRARGGDLYERYRKSGYADGPMFPDTAPAPVVAPDKPAYAKARQLALEMRRPENDPWGAHAGATEIELVEKVFTQHPALYEACRQESYDRG